MLYSYQKATDQIPSPGKVIPDHLKVLPTLVSAIGLGLVASVAWPIASYQFSLLLNRTQSKSSLLSPISYESFASEPDGSEKNKPVLVSDLDYTKASNWFTFQPSEPPPVPVFESQSTLLQLDSTPSASPLVQQLQQWEYSLAIPSLGIPKATVRADTDDLTKSLIQYKQTSFPGQAGAPVIFGHSTLPQFFNANNYLTIFSTLPTIKVGADIFIDYAGVKYTYRVDSLYEVEPNEIWVLGQDYNQKVLKLITCVPPGTKLRRLVVEARLIKS
jgi:LPXTG-site transpeptidase (sortase) family protein